MSGNYPKRQYSDGGNYQGRYRGRNDHYSLYRRDYREEERDYRDHRDHRDRRDERGVRKEYKDHREERGSVRSDFRERGEREHWDREPRDREHREREHREREHREREHRERDYRDREPQDREHRDRNRNRDQKDPRDKERRAPEARELALRDARSPWAAILRVDPKTAARLGASAAELGALNRRLAQLHADRMRLAGAVATLDVYARRDALNAAICAEKLDEFVYM